MIEMSLSSEFVQAFVRGDFDEFSKKGYTHMLRTKFFLKNIFSWYLKDYVIFEAISTMNVKDKETLEFIQTIIDDFKNELLIPIKNLLHDVNIQNDDCIKNFLSGIFNELFSEGITWCRIITFIIFVGEFTIKFRNVPGDPVNISYEGFSYLVQSKLETWILIHGSWEGFKSLLSRKSPTPGPSWAKSLLHSTRRIHGTGYTHSIPVENEISQSNKVITKESEEEDKNLRYCGICCDRERAIVFRNCGHLYCCNKCSAKLRKCPVCREEIVEKLRVHIS